MKPIHCYIARLSLQLSLLDFCKLFGLAPAEVRRWEDYAEKTCGPMGTYGRIVYETLLVILRSLKIDQVVVLLLGLGWGGGGFLRRGVCVWCGEG